MKKLRVAINGFGRVGRNAFKAGWGRKGIEFVSVNDLSEPKILAHLLQYDSVFRKWDHKVTADENNLFIGGVKIPVVAQKEPAKLPWKQYKVDVVVESTGRFTNMDAAREHIKAGAKRVVISAPSKEVPTYLMGVNHASMPANLDVVNNASCTTNSIAPIVAIMHEKFGVKKAMMSTVHSVTAEQNLVDSLPPPLHSDLRRARCALVNIVPTTTGAAKSTTEVIPELKNLFDGIALRVPTIDVSLSDLTMVLRKATSEQEINSVFTAAAKTPRWSGVLGTTDEPLVSSDFIGSSFSCVVDLSMTRVVDGDLAKVLAWYDNEWGYSVHLMDMVEHMGKLLRK